MKPLILSTILALTAISLISGCVKTADVNITGSYDINYVFDFDLSAPTYMGSLCNKDEPIVLSIKGQVERRFYGQPLSVNGRIENASLVWGLSNENVWGSANHAISCSDLIITAIQHRDITITGQAYPIQVTQDSAGRCIIKAMEARSRPNYTLTVRLKGSATRMVNGSNVNDSVNREAGIEYDCDLKRARTVW